MPDRDSPDWPARLELGVAERALAGEFRSGDRAVLVVYEGGALVAAIDGLGHGGDAADAAAAAAEVLSAHPDDDPVHLIEACHRALARGRGAVMTLAWFDLEQGRLALDRRRQRRGPARARRRRLRRPDRGRADQGRRRRLQPAQHPGHEHRPDARAT